MQKNFLWIRRSHSLICKDQNTSTDCSFKDTVNCCAKIAEPCRYCVYSISRIDFIILLKIVPYPNEEDLTALLPALFLVMYFGSLGKAIVQMVFVNCDISMLYYPFIGRKKRSSVGLITVLSNQCFTTESLREVFLSASYYGTC